MDSATQFLLGASISGAVLGPKLGGRAVLLGGIVATLPDLDSFIPMGNAIDDMTYHRGFSHSVILQTLATPAIAFAAAKLVRGARDHPRRLALTVWLCLVTHSLLDSLTTYGTQILWPFEIGPPVALPSVFIIDPVYTLLLLVAVLAFAVLRGRRSTAVTVNRALLALGTLYLCVGIAGQFAVRAKAADHPAMAGMRVHAQPAPFNLYFWEVLAVDETRYVSAMTGILPSCPMTNLVTRPRLAAPPDGFAPGPSVDRLKWFTDGFYTYRDLGDTLAIADLRIGVEPEYPFTFAVARRGADGFEPITPVQLETSRPMPALLGEVAKRLTAGWRACRF
jgi:inner membrane protein